MRMALAALVLMSASAQAAHIDYQPSAEDFPNPERGFSSTYIKDPPTAALLSQKRLAQHISLARRIFSLDDFRDQDLSPAYLRSVNADFSAAREAGVKIVARFAYNFDHSGPDAPLERILRHLDQLQDVLRRNADVLAFVQAGFIGRWGEWHDSDNGLDNTESRSAVVKKLLAVLPPDRMIALRYAEQKKEVFGTRSNLSASEAYGPDPRARVGFHNDCFLASDDDWGTYPKDAPDTLLGQKAWVGRETRYVVMGGETCHLCARAVDCHGVLAEMAQFHYSELNAEYEPQVLKQWSDKGCMDEVQRRLGYRFRLIDAEIPASVQAGATLALELHLRNDGFAAPYNPRPVELVLRNARTREETRVAVETDPRRWLPGETQTLDCHWQVPAGQAPDRYFIFIHFPDPYPSLARNPSYAIRLADQGLWEAATGYNWLKASILVGR
jgi:hypothetical protein